MRLLQPIYEWLRKAPSGIPTACQLFHLSIFHTPSSKVLPHVLVNQRLFVCDVFTVFDMWADPVVFTGRMSQPSSTSSLSFTTRCAEAFGETTRRERIVHCLYSYTGTAPCRRSTYMLQPDKMTWYTRMAPIIALIATEKEMRMINR